ALHPASTKNPRAAPGALSAPREQKPVAIADIRARGDRVVDQGSVATGTHHAVAVADVCRDERSTGGGNVSAADTIGDVGPNHYVQAVNDAFRVFDKLGNPRTRVTTFKSFFAPLTGTPCGANENGGDPFVFYDQLADRWVITDFASPQPKPPPQQPEFPGLEPLGSAPFYECIGVSRTGDPVAGG